MLRWRGDRQKCENLANDRVACTTRIRPSFRNNRICTSFRNGGSIFSADFFPIAAVRLGNNSEHVYGCVVRAVKKEVFYQNALVINIPHRRFRSEIVTRHEIRRIKHTRWRSSRFLSPGPPIVSTTSDIRRPHARYFPRRGRRYARERSAARAYRIRSLARNDDERL